MSRLALRRLLRSLARARGRSRYLPAIRRRPVLSWLAAIAVVGASLGVLQASASATVTVYDVNNAGAFELDGNTAHDSATTPPYDWQDLFNASGQLISHPATLVKGTLILEPAAATDFSFTGGGSKDIYDTSSWLCAVHPVDNKDELTFAGAAMFIPSNGPAAGHKLFYMNLNRGVSTNGSSNAGFWLFKKQTSCNTSTGKFSPPHSDGDLFVFASYTVGGTAVSINVYKWSTASNGLVGLETGQDCPTSNVDVCGVSNPGVGGLPGAFSSPWGQVLTNGFFEAGVDLTNLFGGNSNNVPCFSSFEADTRSTGSSVSGTLKDFASGGFNTCNPSTTLQATTATASPSSIESGSSSTLTFYEKNDGNTVLTSPSVSGSVSPAANASSGCTPAFAGSDNGTGTFSATDTDGSFDPGETWKYTCTVTGITDSITVTATGSGVDPDGNTVTWCTDPNNPPASTICNQNEQTSVGVTVIHPSTDLTAITATASPATIHSGDSTTLTFYEKNSGDQVLTSPQVLLTPSTLCGGAATYAASDNGTNGATFSATDSNVSFDPGETWEFTCTTTAVTSTTTVTAIGSAVDPLNNTVTYCTDTTHPPSNTICSQNERTTVQVTVINPNTSLTETASAVITFTFVEKNNGDAALTEPAGGWITDDQTASGACSSTPIFVSDTDGDGVTSPLDVGESMTFTCTHTLQGPAASPTDGSPTSATNTGTGHGIDATGTDITAPAYGGETDGVTVTITNN